MINGPYVIPADAIHGEDWWVIAAGVLLLAYATKRPAPRCAECGRRAPTKRLVRRHERKVHNRG